MSDTSQTGREDGRREVDTRYNLDALPEWTPRTEENSGEGWTGLPRWAGKADMARGAGFDTPPAVGTRVLVNFNDFGLGTVRGYFVEVGWLGLYVEVDKRPEWHVKQNGAQFRMPMVFGSEVFIAPEVVLSRAAGGHKRHVRIKGSMRAFCGFAPSSPKDRPAASGLKQKSRAGWYLFPDGTQPDGGGNGCKECLAHPSARYLAYFTDQLDAARQSAKVTK